jgi:hypothetical protein
MVEVGLVHRAGHHRGVPCRAVSHVDAPPRLGPADEWNHHGRGGARGTFDRHSGLADRALCRIGAWSQGGVGKPRIVTAVQHSERSHALRIAIAIAIAIGEPEHGDEYRE